MVDLLTTHHVRPYINKTLAKQISDCKGAKKPKDKKGQSQMGGDQEMKMSFLSLVIHFCARD